MLLLLLVLCEVSPLPLEVILPPLLAQLLVLLLDHLLLLVLLLSSSLRFLILGDFYFQLCISLPPCSLNAPVEFCFVSELLLLSLQGVDVPPQL